MITRILPTTTATEEHDRGTDVALLPVGSYEQHGSHLPLITDTLVACVLAKKLADTYHLRLLPPITMSCSHEHERLLAGSASIRAQTLNAVINDIMASLERQGIHRLALINSHGGNYVLSNVVQEASVSKSHRMLLYPTMAAWNAARSDSGCSTTTHQDMHGGELETSILLYATPELVRDNWRNADHHADDRPDLLVGGMSLYTSTGIIGLPSQASASKGSAILASLTSSFEKRLAHLRRSQSIT